MLWIEEPETGQLELADSPSHGGIEPRYAMNPFRNVANHRMNVLLTGPLLM